MVHVGQTEDVAGQGAGKQFKSAGAKKVLIVIHEASNSGLQQRADGVKKILGVGRRQGADDPEREVGHPGHEGEGAGGVQGQQVARRLPRPRPGRDDPVPRRAPEGHEGGHVRRRRRDQGDPGRAGMLFAIDQQQYLQGYLPVVFAMLYVTNLNTVGNGAAGADRARDHQQGERGAGRGARRRRARARTDAARAGGVRPPAPPAQPMAETAAPQPTPHRRAADHASARSTRLLDAPGHRRVHRRGRRLASRSATSRAASTGSATRRSQPAGPTRPRSTGSSPCRSRC